MIYKIYDPESGDTYYVNLTAEQKKVIDWLDKRSLLYPNVEIIQSDIPRVETP